MALLASGLLSFAAPVFAQNLHIGDNVQYNAVCQNIIGSIGDINQNQEGNANAVADADATAGGEGTTAGSAEANAEAVAEVAQEQNVSIAQVNECLNEAAGGPGENPPPGGDTTDRTSPTPRADTTGADTTGADTTGSSSSSKLLTVEGEEIIIDTIPEQKVLADTGGPLVLLPALGLIFLASGGTMLKILLRR